MDYKIVGLLVTLILGMFILIGSIISFCSKSKDKYVDFSISLAFGVMLMLIFLDLIPEIAESLRMSKIYLFILFVILGYVLLKVLDHFIPDHDAHKNTKKEVSNNLVHIGILSSIALVIHNIIEGMAIYSTVLISASTALVSMIGVGAHNIPLGMVITTTLYQNNNSKSKTLFIILLLSISTFIGGLIMYFLNSSAVNEMTVGILLSITVGMFIYILLNELYPKLKQKDNRKIKILGLIFGIAIIILTSLI